MTPRICVITFCHTRVYDPHGVRYMLHSEVLSSFLRVFGIVR